MERIILEDRFSTHQKLFILLGLGGPFLAFLIGLIMKVNQINYIGYIILLFDALIYFLFIAIAFFKRGFIKKGDKLYKASFFMNKLFFKTRINIENKPKLAVLKFKKSQKFAFFNVANPDMAYSFNSFEINILSENHTKREPIITLKKEESSEKTVQFLTDLFPLENEVFSPDFSKGAA